MTTPKDKRIREVDNKTRNAIDSLNDIKEATEFTLDSIERIGIFSQRTAGVLLGAALGGILGIATIISTSGTRLEIPPRYKDLIVLFSGIAGASSGALFVKESNEEKQRRLERAARKMDDPSLAQFKQNLFEQHQTLSKIEAFKASSPVEETVNSKRSLPEPPIAQRAKFVTETKTNFLDEDETYVE